MNPSDGRERAGALRRDRVPFVHARVVRAEKPTLVASRKRGAAVVGSLEVDAAERARVRTPAGLDIGARRPEEVALSILAEIVATRPRPVGLP